MLEYAQPFPALHMKKLYVSVALCIALMLTAKYGYVMDYRLSDAGPLSVVTAKAKTCSKDDVDRQKKWMWEKKAEKTKRWEAYNKTKADRKKIYEENKVKAREKYLKDKEGIKTQYKNDKASALAYYKNKKGEAWKLYKGQKDAAKDKYNKAKAAYEERKEEYQKCKEDKGSGCDSKRDKYIAAGNERNQLREHYKTVTDPENSNSSRAKYDRTKASERKLYEKKLEAAKKTYAANKTKALEKYNSYKASLKKDGETLIGQAKAQYTPAKQAYLKAKQEYEATKQCYENSKRKEG